MTTLQPELCKALASAFPEIEGAIKDKNNQYFKSKYADFANVVSAVKPALAKYGLCFVQPVHHIEGYAAVETIIIHESGQTLSCGVTSVPVLGKKGQADVDAQAYGSALTYARRYSLSSAFGVAPEEVGAFKDDDGNRACNKKAQESPVIVEEKKKMSHQELLDYAAEVSRRLCSEARVVMGSEFPKFCEWLSFCNENGRRPVREGIEEMMAKNPKEVIDAFDRWIEKRKSSPLETHKPAA